MLVQHGQISSSASPSPQIRSKSLREKIVRKVLTAVVRPALRAPRGFHAFSLHFATFTILLTIFCFSSLSSCGFASPTVRVLLASAVKKCSEVMWPQADDFHLEHKNRYESLKIEPHLKPSKMSICNINSIMIKVSLSL